MDNNMMELMKQIEKLTTPELQQLFVWLNFNLEKRSETPEIFQKK